MKHEREPKWAAVYRDFVVLALVILIAGVVYVGITVRQAEHEVAAAVQAANNADMDAQSATNEAHQADQDAQQADSDIGSVCSAVSDIPDAGSC
ncbi:MAG TPA: hypothetical protein VGS28_02275 [Candidatus Saccharimonadales bacterium]|nr:hypothetical protein [Candidatus Saccharimonadales bacterium]